MKTSPHYTKDASLPTLSLQWIGSVVVSLSIMGFSLGIGIWGLISTNLGAYWLGALLHLAQPGLEFSQITGNLNDGLTINQVSFEHDKHQITFEHVKLTGLTLRLAHSESNSEPEAEPESVLFSWWGLAVSRPAVTVEHMAWLSLPDDARPTKAPNVNQLSNGLLHWPNPLPNISIEHILVDYGDWHWEGGTFNVSPEQGLAFEGPGIQAAVAPELDGTHVRLQLDVNDMADFNSQWHGRLNGSAQVVLLPAALNQGVVHAINGQIEGQAIHQDGVPPYSFKWQAQTKDGVQNHHLSVPGIQVSDWQVVGRHEPNGFTGEVTASRRLNQQLQTAAKGRIRITESWPIFHLNYEVNQPDMPAHTGHLQLNTDTFEVSGLFQGRWQELSWLNHWQHHFLTNNGHAKYQMRLSGTLAAMVWAGHAELHQIDFELPAFGTSSHIDTLRLEKPKKSAIWQVQAQGRIGEGPLDIHGTYHAHARELSLSGVGSNWALIQSPELFIKGGGQIQYSANPTQASLTGALDITESWFHAKPKKHSVSSSPDVIIKQHTAKPKASNSTLTLQPAVNLTLNFTQPLAFQGYHAEAKVQGKLALRKAPGQLLLADGQLKVVDGLYNAYGRVFTITNGSVRYQNSPFTTPYIDVRAERTISRQIHAADKPLRVGVNVSGRVTDLNIKPFANEGMSESDILSYMILNHPQSEASQGQGALLLQAIQEIADASGPDSRKSLLNQFDIHLSKTDGNQSEHSQNPFEETMVNIGTQITPKLYLEVGQGLSDDSRNIGLKYKLGNHWTLEANTGSDGGGADLMYELESG